MKSKQQQWREEQRRVLTSSSSTRQRSTNDSRRRIVSSQGSRRSRNSLDQTIDTTGDDNKCRTTSRFPSIHSKHGSRSSIASVSQRYHAEKQLATMSAGGAAAVASTPSGDPRRVSLKDILQDSIKSLDAAIGADESNQQEDCTDVGLYGCSKDKGVSYSVQAPYFCVSHQPSSQAFDRELFLRMPHPLDCGGSLSGNMDSLWEVQSALKDLKRYLSTRESEQLVYYIPCQDPNTGMYMERQRAKSYPVG